MSDPWADFVQPQQGADPWADFVQPASAPQGGVMGALKGASRALENNLPGMDRAVAAWKTPHGTAGSDYAANLAAEEAKNEQFAKDNYWTNMAGGITAAAPLFAGAEAFGLGGLGARIASKVGPKFGDLASRVVTSAIPFGGFGTIQGALSSPDLTNLPETAEDAAIGGASSAALGAAVPLAGAGIAKALSPFKVAPERQAFVETLHQAGVNPTAGQVTGNKTLGKLEAAAGDIPFGGGGAEVPREANSLAFTAALMEKAGAEPGQIATPENLNALHESLGNQFNELGARNSITIDPQLRTEIGKAVSDYHDVTGTPAPGVAKTADGLIGDEAEISGEKYNNVRSQFGKQAQALRFSDPAQAQAYRDMQSALDDAIERSIRPEDQGAFQDVRAKYGNLASLEKAAGSAGSDAARGIISPAQMRTALASGNNRRAYARGIGDMAPLTNAGNAVLTNFPQSGTAPRILAAHLLGAGVGGGVGYHEGGLPGALAGIAAPALGARALMSRPVQSLLANQLMRGPAASKATNQAALAAALAARQQLPRQENTQQ
jgi:hypothetical protein